MFLDLNDDGCDKWQQLPICLHKVGCTFTDPLQTSVELLKNQSAKETPTFLFYIKENLEESRKKMNVEKYVSTNKFYTNSNLN